MRLFPNPKKELYFKKFGQSNYYLVSLMNVGIIGLILLITVILSKATVTFDNVNNVLSYRQPIIYAVPICIIAFVAVYNLIKYKLKNTKWMIPEFKQISIAYALAIYLFSFVAIIFINCHFDKSELIESRIDLDYGNKAGCFRVLGEYSSERVRLCNIKSGELRIFKGLNIHSNVTLFIGQGALGISWIKEVSID